MRVDEVQTVGRSLVVLGVGDIRMSRTVPVGMGVGRSTAVADRGRIVSLWH